MRKNRKSKNIINSELPLDIHCQILMKLPFPNLLTCMLVCKAWNTCISSFKLDSNLYIAQISRGRSRNRLDSVDLDPKHLKGMNIVGSFKLHPTWSSSSTRIANTCNGLLCILNVERVAILNPMTNEYMELPRDQHQPQRYYYYGLGFSPKTRQYKIARCSLENGGVLVEISAFGTNLKDQDEVQIQWRDIGRMSTSVEMNRHGVYFNGAIYWVGVKGERNVLWRLNVTDENFEEVWLPEIGAIWKNAAYCGVLNGKLYLSHYTRTDYKYHVWMMDGEGLWERLFSITVSISLKLYKGPVRLVFYHFQPIKLCEDGKILCLLHSFLLVVYDPKTGELEKFDQVEDETNKPFGIYHMDSINFHSLLNILAGDVAAA